MKSLIIVKEAKSETYKNLIKYMCQTCDTMMYIIRYDDLMTYIVDFDRICKLLKMNEKQVIDEYNKNGLKNILEKTENDEVIFEFENTKYAYMYDNELKKIILRNIIKFYEKAKEEYQTKRKSMNQIKEKLKEDLMLERHNPEWCMNESAFKSRGNLEEKKKIEYKYNKEYVYDICFYRISNRIKTFLLEQNRLYKFLPPNLPENISFFRNGKVCQKQDQMKG